MLTLPRVPADEAAPFYEPFLSMFPDGQVTVHLQEQAGALQALCVGLSESHAMFRYAAGKWTIKEVIGHLLDTERVFAYRLLRISRGDVTPLPGFDESSYVPAGEFNGRRLHDLVSEFELQRASTVALANGVPAAAWLHTAVANGFRTSARALVYIILGHTEHHFGILRERYKLPNPESRIPNPEPDLIMQVIVITGSMGAGKTTILGEASDLLSAGGIVHAAIDLDAVNAPLLPDATARELTLQNLAAICANFRAAGIDRLLLAEAVESRADLERIAAAAGARSIVVCRVAADLATLQRRVRAREPGMLQEQFVARARELDAILSAAAVEDFTVANDGGQSVTAVARELLQRARWLAA